MKIMGLDISTKVGLSVGDFSLPVKDALVYSAKLEEPDLKRWDRTAALAERLLRVVELWKPDLVMIEDYAFAFKGAGIPLVEVGGCLRYFLWQENMKVLDGVAPTTLKKFATGRGDVPKDIMIKEIYKRFGFDTDDNDIADAAWLVYFGAAVEGIDLGLPKNNMGAVAEFLRKREEKANGKATKKSKAVK